MSLVSFLLLLLLLDVLYVRFVGGILDWKSLSNLSLPLIDASVCLLLLGSR